MRKSSRCKVVAGFGVAATAMLVSSTAFACTTYLGSLQASGNGTGNVSQTVKGDGSVIGGMNWCSTYTPTVKVATAASISLVTSQSTCLVSSKMSAGTTYNVKVDTAGYMPQGGGGTAATHNCHSSNGTPIDTGASVSSTGVFKNSGGVNNTEAYTTTRGNQSICIYNTANADAIAINYDAV